MKVIEGHLYFIKDEFIDKYNSKYHLMENKSKTKRPSYFALEIDKIEIYCGLYQCQHNI